MFHALLLDPVVVVRCKPAAMAYHWSNGAALSVDFATGSALFDLCHCPWPRQPVLQKFRIHLGTVPVRPS
jgi:hypothetical protein